MNEDQKITYLGETNFRNKKVKFGIKKNDRRKHVYIIGKTGMGKTTLLENMAIQDIQSGEGIAFIDPHGDTAEKLLDFIPEERIKDVIYFNPADTEFPIGLNVMENVAPDRRHLVADGLMGVFKKIWQDVWSPRMEYILNNTILALLEYPNATMLGINQMLVNKDFRKKVVDTVKDPVIKAFWTQEFAKYTDRYAAEATPAIQNKVGQFVSNPLIRNIIGQQKSSFNFREAMDQRKIIIVNLSKGRVGEDNSRLLGAMFVTKLYLAAMSRVDIVENTRNDFFLYVDEFQNFASESFANILSEARKYRLSLILTHQYIMQMDEKVTDAVFGNIGTMACFRVGAEDAEALEKEFAPIFTVQDIVNLPFAQIYLKLMIDGVASQPFSAATLLPIMSKGESLKNRIIESSRKIYGSSKKDVEAEIEKWAEEVGSEITPAAIRASAAPTKLQTSFRPPQDLHDAVCAVCGKKTQVPFKPDPNRPVFCKEHIGMAGKFNEAVKHYGGPPREERNFATSREANPEPPRSPRVGVFSGPPVARHSPGEDSGYVSLKDLQNSDRQPARSPQRPPQRPASSDLTALREALKKSLEAKKADTRPEPPKEEIKSNSGTLKPGERIEL